MVKVYALTTCPYCKKTLRFFEEKGITPEVIFLDELDPDEKEMAMKEIYSYAGVYAVPVVVHRNTVVVGFDEEKLEKLVEEIKDEG